MDLPEPIHRVQITSNTAGIQIAAPEAPIQATKKVSDETVDLSADDPVDEQIQADRANVTEQDLLDPNAPQE